MISGRQKNNLYIKKGQLLCFSFSFLNDMLTCWPFKKCWTASKCSGEVNKKNVVNMSPVVISHEFRWTILQPIFSKVYKKKTSKCRTKKWTHSHPIALLIELPMKDRIWSIYSTRKFFLKCYFQYNLHSPSIFKKCFTANVSYLFKWDIS